MDIRFINVEHSIKFKSIAEATKEANRLKMLMDRFSKKSKIPFMCLCAVSDLSLRMGEYVLFHNGKKGRPYKKPVSKIKLFELPETVEPHLHIFIVYTQQGKKISNKIVDSIVKKYGEKSSRAYDITNNDPFYFLQYIVRQSPVLRFVDDFSRTIELDLKKTCRTLLKQKDNFYFHNNNRYDSRFRLPAA